MRINYIHALYLSSVSVITMFLNVTPDGIGVNEAVYAFSSSLLGISAENLVFGSMISRVITILVSFILGGGSYIILQKKMKK